MNHQHIVSHLPYEKPFLFVDELTHVDTKGATGSFTFHREMYFYQGHFKDHPVTPGVLLTECCAQIGLVCLGIYLLQGEGVPMSNLQVGLSSSEMEFLLPVYPGEKVTVHSEKVYFRFNKLKCSVKMHNEEGQLVCKGILSGMFKNTADE
ncbi:hydroxymyristoyl-ACP dehydratase [Flavobacteriaceae bacterium TP-CH-4]|uniref:Hydroxymyristoyl-ACP dehydratase n=1 Tax=Pelagihabitans pacificus TaxID=2696054 RepID=A0A967AYP2_9FLAO|nr:FabA/FabZ family ACP-dehydratase [Pelagihabitans pacificus]NHF60012.1 hydroxymyristoyl-ACP dehydratase [Pelagihabitans pacificus]